MSTDPDVERIKKYAWHIDNKRRARSSSYRGTEALIVTHAQRRAIIMEADPRDIMEADPREYACVGYDVTWRGMKIITTRRGEHIRRNRCIDVRGLDRPPLPVLS